MWRVTMAMSILVMILPLLAALVLSMAQSRLRDR
jgi:hypothetical protein